MAAPAKDAVSQEKAICPRKFGNGERSAPRNSGTTLCPSKLGSSSGPAALSKGRSPRTGIGPGFVAG